MAGMDAFAHWDVEISRIPKAGLRKRSIKRRDHAEKEFDKLLERLEDFEPVLYPLIHELNGIVKYLEFDLSEEAIDHIDGFFGEIRDVESLAKDGRKEIAELIAELDAVVAAKEKASRADQ